MPPSTSDNQRDPTEAMRRLGLGFIGFFLALASLGLAGGVVYQWLSAGLSASSVGGAAGAMLGLFLASWMLRSAMRKKTPTRSREDLLASSGARGVLRVAQSQGGEITVGEAAIECRLSTQDARDILDAFYLEGVCEQDLSASGQEVYLFSDFVEAQPSEFDALLNDELLNDEPFEDELLSEDDEIARQFEALLDENPPDDASITAKAPAHQVASHDRS